jgi:DNA-binding MarR family transcriptional regulator
MSSDAKLDLIINLDAAFTRSLKQIDGRLSAHGISYTELMVLHRLNAASNQSMRRIDLADAIGLTASGVTRLLLPMEKRHLVGREANPRDARVSLIKLTAAGKKLYRDAFPTFQFCTDALTRNLTEKQVSTLSELLNIVN